MLYCMDEKLQGTSKKKIRDSNKSINYEDDYYIPIAANDSQWNGIKFVVPKNENTEHINSTTEDETELTVVELEAEESPPLLLLFPELKKEELNFQNIINHQMSTTDVTKILVGKKPNLALLKPCKRLDITKDLLSPLVEVSESDDSMENERPQKKIVLDEKNRRKDSRDADDSDNCDYDY